MTRSESTSKRLASIAARRMDDPDPEVRALAGSVLTQYETDPAKHLEAMRTVRQYEEREAEATGPIPDRSGVMDKPKLAFIAEMDQAELACLMLEALMQKKRPAGKTAREVLAELDPINQETWKRVSHAAMMFFQDSIEALKRVS